MWDESTAFSKRVHTIELQIKGLKKAADTLITHSEKILSSPLPQDYVQDEAGVHPVAGTGSSLITAGQLPRTKSLELQSAVFDPIAQYQTEHIRLRARMAELDKASLRLDEARRKHYKGAEKELKENVMKQDNVSAHRQTENEDPLLTGARAAFMKLETEVHEELWRHAQNARGVQTYITRAMELQAARLNDAAHVHRQPPAGGVPAASAGGSASAGGISGAMHPGAAAGGPVGGGSASGVAH